MFNKRKKTRVSFIIHDHVLRLGEVKQDDMSHIEFVDEFPLEVGMISEGKIVNRTKLKELLEEIVKTYELKRKEMLFIVPDAHVVLRKLPYPEGVNEAELKQYLYLEIGSSIILPFEHAIFDYEIYENNQQKELILVAAEQSFVNEYADLFEEVGLFPVAADISILCLTRIYNYITKRPKVNEHLLFIQFNIQSANFSYVHNETPLLSQHLPLDEFTHWKEKNDENGFLEYYWAGAPESIDRQIVEVLQSFERSIKFYEETLSPGVKVEKVILTGDYPYLEKAKEAIEETNGLSVYIFNEHEFETVDGLPVSSNQLLTLGLALKEVTL